MHQFFADTDMKSQSTLLSVKNNSHCHKSTFNFEFPTRVRFPPDVPKFPLGGISDG